MIARNEAPADWKNPHVARVLPHGDVAVEEGTVHLAEATCACGDSTIPNGMHTARYMGSDIIHVRKETGETCGAGI